MQPFKAMELRLKASVLGAEAAILSATRTNAALFGLADRIGTVAEGKRADLIVVDGQPLDDVGLLAEAANVRLVLRDGEIMKRTLDRGLA
jgi:imidazolonepropionase-like amidohydrolase